MKRRGKSLLATLLLGIAGCMPVERRTDIFRGEDGGLYVDVVSPVWLDSVDLYHNNQHFELYGPKPWNPRFDYFKKVRDADEVTEGPWLLRSRDIRGNELFDVEDVQPGS